MSTQCRAVRPPATVRAAMPRVAFQGEHGAFGDEAIRRHWRGGAHPLPARSFPDVLALVCQRRVDYAVLPVWNSAIGDVRAACDALASRADEVEAIDEVLLPVRHCLLALPGLALERLRSVGSHPAALGQCARFFADHPRLAPRDAYDTAGAARQLSRLVRDPGHPDLAGAWYAGLAGGADTLAVIASAAAAERYDLAILADGIQDDPTNATRFVVLRAR